MAQGDKIRFRQGLRSDVGTTAPQAGQLLFATYEDELKIYDSTNSSAKIDVAQGDIYLDYKDTNNNITRINIANDVDKARTLYSGETSTNDATGHWTATIEGLPKDSLGNDFIFDGLTIALRINSYISEDYYNTLNLNGTGEKLIWLNPDTVLTDQIDRYSEVILTYRKHVGSSYTPPTGTGYGNLSGNITDGWVIVSGGGSAGSNTSGIYFVKGTQTASTASWTGNLPNVNKLFDGLTIAYYLPFAGTSTSATLTLTLGKGANEITTAAEPVYYTSTTRATTHYGVGSTILLTWVSNATTGYSAIGSASGRWTRADYNSDANTYTSAYCTTAASTVAKTASCSYYSLQPNSYIHVLFRYTNTAANPTLNINSTGAKPIYVNGSRASSSNQLLAGTYIAFYDGTNYYVNTNGNIPGYIDVSSIRGSSALPVTYGGTGNSTLTSGALLQGNGTNAISSASAAGTSSLPIYINSNGIPQTITSYEGNSASATKLNTVRTIAISGAITGTATSFDGTENITIPVTGIDLSYVSNGTLGVAYGGTGKSTLTRYAVLVGAGTDQVSLISAGANGGAFFAENDSSNPKFGTLPVSSGGTGNTSFTSGEVLIGNGSGALSTKSILNNTSKSALGWNTAGATNTNNLRLVNVNTIAYWNGAYNGTSSNLSVLGTITTGTWNASTIGVAYGGTGAGTLTSGALLQGNGTNPISAAGSKGSASLPIYIDANGKPQEITSYSGKAATAGKLDPGATIALSGMATGTATAFDGSANITIPVTKLTLSGTGTSLDGTLPVAYGGTGQNAALVAGRLIYAKSTTEMAPTNFAVMEYTTGTTSVVGKEELKIGNSTKSGTNGNAQGKLSIYSSNTAGASITAASSTSWTDHVLPATAGWIVTAGNGSSTGAGSSTKPVYISTAGVATAVSDNSLIVNLESTNGASVYTAAPRPGITGILGTAYGGTGSGDPAQGLANLGGAPLNSPAFTGTPTAPTATAGTNTTQIATTAFVMSAVSSLVGPMKFIGTVGTGGTVTSLPAASSSNKGYTYKVISAITVNNNVLNIGDMVVSDGSAWVVIPSGDEPSGTVVGITGTAPIQAYEVGTTSPIVSSGNISLATAYGDTQNPYGSKTKNYVLAAPSNANGNPSFRALVAADIPNLSTDKLTSGTLPVGRGGTGLTAVPYAIVDLSSSSSNSLFTSSTSTNPIKIGVTNTLPVSYGGTGLGSLESGKLLVGNNANNVTFIEKTSSNIANTVVQRDASGNFSAGTITATLSGNASSATKLNTAGTIITNLSSTTAATYTDGGNIAPGIEGTLPVAYGGTNAGTAGGALNNLVGSSNIGSDLKFIYYEVNSTNHTGAFKATAQTKGSATKPIYLSSGTITEGNTYAGGTAITLNGTSKSATTASFYAPTGSGTAGQVLLAGGNNTAPTWSTELSVVSSVITSSAKFKSIEATDSTYSKDEVASIYTAGGLSVAKNASVKSLRIDNGQTTKGVSLQYNETTETLNFVFA